MAKVTTCAKQITLSSSLPSTIELDEDGRKMVCAICFQYSLYSQPYMAKNNDCIKRLTGWQQVPYSQLFVYVHYVYLVYHNFALCCISQSLFYSIVPSEKPSGNEAILNSACITVAIVLSAAFISQGYCAASKVYSNVESHSQIETAGLKTLQLCNKRAHAYTIHACTFSYSLTCFNQFFFYAD